MEFNGFDMASTELRSVKSTLHGVALRDDQKFNLALPTSTAAPFLLVS